MITARTVARPRAMARPHLSGRGKRLVLYLVLLVMVLAILFPIYWMITISLKLPREIYRQPSLWPEVVTLANYRRLIEEKHFLTNIKNSLIVASTVTVLSLLISSFAGYSLVRFRYRFKGVIGRLILFAYLTPTSLLFIPLSVIIARLHLGNSLRGLIIVYLTFALPLSTWLLSGYFRSVPAELEEQAMVDGCTQWQAFYRVLLPTARPGLGAAALFAFILSWNDLFYALLLSGGDSRTLPVGVAGYWTFRGVELGQMSAAILLSITPMIVLSFLVQRYLVRGFGGGIVKG